MLATLKAKVWDCRQSYENHSPNFDHQDGDPFGMQYSWGEGGTPPCTHAAPPDPLLVSLGYGGYGNYVRDGLHRLTHANQRPGDT